MAKNFRELKNALAEARLIELPQLGRKKYLFKTFSFGERGARLSAELLGEITQGFLFSIKKNFPKFDYIVSPEPGGHTWGSIVAYQLGKPINIVRSNPSYSQGEIEVRRETAYYHHSLYFSHFKKGDKVLIIDDIVSSGGTLETLLSTLNKLGVALVGVHVIHVKTDVWKKLEKKYNIPIRFLA